MIPDRLEKPEIEPVIPDWFEKPGIKPVIPDRFEKLGIEPVIPNTVAVAQYDLCCWWDIKHTHTHNYDICSSAGSIMTTQG